MCHRQEGHEAAIGQILPTTVAFVAINPPAAGFVQIQRQRLFSDSTVEERVNQASVDGLGVGERGLGPASGGLGCSRLAPGASGGRVARAGGAPLPRTSSQEAARAVSGGGSAGQQVGFFASPPLEPLGRGSSGPTWPGLMVPPTHFPL